MTKTKKTEEKLVDRYTRDRICMFCGKEEQEHWDEYTRYYECRCADVLFNQELDKKIKELEKQRRKPKFSLVKRVYLVKK